MIRLFVAGFREATNADLVALFAQFGVTEADITFPRDRRSRRKKGYAYVNVSSEAAADTSIKMLNLLEIDGKQLTVIRASDRPPKRPRR
jgi:RNA recognition motif-containing protein